MGVTRLVQVIDQWIARSRVPIRVEKWPAERPGFVYIEDIMTRLYRCGGPNMTLDRFFERMFAPYRAAFESGGCRIAVMVFDNSTIAIPTKSQTQAERRDRSQLVAYPASTVMLNHQLVDGQSPVQGIDAPRLCATAQLRNALADAFWDWLTAPIPGRSWPRSTFLVVDNGDCARLFNPHGISAPLGLPSDSHQWVHTCREGEAEIRAVQWIFRLREHAKEVKTFVVETLDSDMLALATYHVWPFVIKYNDEIRYWWRRPPAASAKDQVAYCYDLNQLVHRVLKDRGSRDTFLSWTVLLGTDHFRSRQHIAVRAPDETMYIELRGLGGSLPHEHKNTLQLLAGKLNGDTEVSNEVFNEFRRAFLYWSTLASDASNIPVLEMEMSSSSAPPSPVEVPVPQPLPRAATVPRVSWERAKPGPAVRIMDDSDEDGWVREEMQSALPQPRSTAAAPRRPVGARVHTALPRPSTQPRPSPVAAVAVEEDDDDEPWITDAMTGRDPLMMRSSSSSYGKSSRKPFEHVIVPMPHSSRRS
jgi:hypothetical protein